MADVLARACPLCLGVYLGSQMLEFSVEEQATKSRRTIQICGTCAGNIADAVYNQLTAADKEATSDAANVDRGISSPSDAAPDPATTGAVVLEGESRDRGSRVDSGESAGAAGGAGAGTADKSSKPPERIEQSTGVKK